VEPRVFEVKCPKCSEIVDRVDGEYARHYVVASIVCSASRREIVENEAPKEGQVVKKIIKHTAKVRLPECWKRLVDVVFSDDLKGILSEKTDHTGVADPKPHYDDARRVVGKFHNGAEFSLELCSGQGNYYGGLSIIDGDREYSNVLEDFSALEVEMEDGHIYEIEVEWVPDGEWTENRKKEGRS